MRARTGAGSNAGQSRGGFTLVELLVALAVTATLLVLLAAVFRGVTDQWIRFEGRVGVDREARAAFQVIEDDLGSLWVAAGNSSLHIPFECGWDVYAKESGPEPEPRVHSKEIAFVTAKPELAQNLGEDRSELCIVGYYLAVVPRSDGRTGPPYTQALFRYFKGSNEAFESTRKPIPDPDFEDYFEAQDGLAAKPETLFPQATTGEPVKHPDDEMLAVDVIQFRVIPYWPDTETTVATMPGELWSHHDPDTPAPTLLPTYIDIVLRVANEETARKLAGSDRADDWRGQGLFAHLLVGDPATPDDYRDDPGVRTFTTRIYLGGN